MAAAFSSKSWLWVGRVLSAIPILMFLSGIFMLVLIPKVVDEGMNKYGYTHHAGVVVTIIEFIIGVLMLIPRTSLFGLLFFTAYLGGAVATHVRLGEPFILPVIFALFGWAGLWLREPRLRNLVPIRK